MFLTTRLVFSLEDKKRSFSTPYRSLNAARAEKQFVIHSGEQKKEREREFTILRKIRLKAWLGPFRSPLRQICTSLSF